MPMTQTKSSIKLAAYWIQKLDLAPHPEGGYYRQTYRADLALNAQSLSPQFTGPRSASTAIYFLLEGTDFSAFHRLRSDELWHFYQGQTLEVHVIESDGSYSTILLGSDPEAGETFQSAVKAGCWFASRLAPTENAENSFALVGCTVAPGFDFEDFELARRDDLQQEYPEHARLIAELTRE
jgi:predicted cupin superfamily sugar epimerase